MTDNIIPFPNTTPPTPTDYHGHTCTECGNSWFNAAVAFNHDGTIHTFATLNIVCTQCGHNNAETITTP